MGEDKKSKDKNSNKNITWLIVVLIVIIVGLGGYVIYDKVSKDDNSNAKETENNNQSNNNDKENTEGETNEILAVEVDSKKIDPQLESYLLPLTYAFEGLSATNVTYSQNLLDANAKFKFAWGVAELEKMGTYIKEDQVDYDLGNYYVNYDKFKSLYKRLYGVEFDGNYPTSGYPFVKQGDNLYGVTFTGYSVPNSTYITLNKVLKQGNIYNLTIDIYEKETMTKKDCQLKMVVEKVNNDYQFKSIMLVK